VKNTEENDEENLETEEWIKDDKELDLEDLLNDDTQKEESPIHTKE